MLDLVGFEVVVGEVAIILSKTAKALRSIGELVSCRPRSGSDSDDVRGQMGQ